MRLFSHLSIVALTIAIAIQVTAQNQAVLDPNLVVLLSDIHLTPNPEITKQRDGFNQSVADILAMNPRPATLLIMGDLSHRVGLTEDYIVLRTLIKPIEEAGIKWYACLGNHDRHNAFFTVFPELKDRSMVPGRHVTVVDTPLAEFILLDSCLDGLVHGRLDEAQRKWLEKYVTQNKKPLFIGAHHAIRETMVADIMTNNPRCKGYFYGHHHIVTKLEEQGVHTLCLPASGHNNDNGYVIMRLTPDAAELKLIQRNAPALQPYKWSTDNKPEWSFPMTCL